MIAEPDWLSCYKMLLYIPYEIHVFFYKKKVYINRQNLEKIVRKSWGWISKIKCYHKQKKSVFHRYCIQNVKDGIHIHVYNSINHSLNHYSQVISVKVKKNLRKSQAQFREKLRKLRLRENNDFLIKECAPKLVPLPHTSKYAIEQKLILSLHGSEKDNLDMYN